jgi:hypothetical protein
MDLSSSAAPERDYQIWDRFLKVLQDQGINQRYWRWYMLRVEQYLKVNNDTPLEQHTSNEVTAYLRKIGRTGSLLIHNQISNMRM